MFGNDPNELDPIAIWILLLLSGSQRFSIMELSRSLDRPFENIWAALQSLMQNQYVKNDKGKFMITAEGKEFLLLRGIMAADVEDEPEPKDFIRRIRPPFFSSFEEMFIWLAFPLILLILAFFLSGIVTAGYNFISIDKRLIQAAIRVLYVALVGLYIKFTYHNVVENERLVIFRGGKVISKRGPGPVLLLPLVDNPEKVDLRERSKEINKEPCITRDNILVNTGFYITWHIDNPILSLTKVSNVDDAMTLLSTAVLRSTIAEYSLENTLDMRRH